MKTNSILSVTCLFYGVFLFACSTGTKADKDHGIKAIREIQTIKVSTLGNDSTICLSDFLKDVKIVPLEFTKECMLGDIKKVVMYDSCFYVQDEQNTAGIFKFDKNGQFIRRIGIQGNGPREHSDLTDFSVNQQAKRLYLYDNAKQRINEFNLDGQYLKEIQVGHSAENFEYRDSLIYLYRFSPALYEDHDLIIKNMEGKTIARYFKSDPLNFGKYKKVFSLSNNCLFVSPVYSDTVYSLIKDSLYYSYLIDIGKYKIRQDDMKRILRNQVNTVRVLVANNYATPVHGFFKVKDLVFFSNTLKIIQNYSFCNIKTKRIVTSCSLLDDISYLYFCEPISQTDNALIGAYSPTALDHNIEIIRGYLKTRRFKQLSTKKGEQLISKLMSFKKNGIARTNPLLIIYDVK